MIFLCSSSFCSANTLVQNRFELKTEEIEAVELPNPREDEQKLVAAKRERLTLLQKRLEILECALAEKEKGAGDRPAKKIKKEEVHAENLEDDIMDFIN